MEYLLILCIGFLYAVAVYMLLGRTLIKLIIGIFVLSNVVHLTIFVLGRLTRDAPPLITEGAMQPAQNAANALPQAMILTAIVISFALFAFILVLIYRGYRTMQSIDSDKMREAEPVETEPHHWEAVP